MNSAQFDYQTKRLKFAKTPSARVRNGWNPITDQRCVFKKAVGDTTMLALTRSSAFDGALYRQFYREHLGVVGEE
jgi:hypothetical protein